MFASLLIVVGTAEATTHVVAFFCCEYIPSNFQATVGDTVVWQGDFNEHPLESTTIPSGAVPFSNKIYDLLGREVATVVNEEMPPGRYKVTWDASGMVSGVYLYQLTAGSFASHRKLVLIR